MEKELDSTDCLNVWLASVSREVSTDEGPHVVVSRLGHAFLRRGVASWTR